MVYAAPDSLAKVLQKIEFEEALQPDDPRLVDTTAARGSDATARRFQRKFGWHAPDFFPPAEKHVLFFGHIGAGKSTELRRYSKELEKCGHFLVVEVDVTTELDRNNLQYADVLLAMAQKLMDALSKRPDVQLPDDALKPLRSWFVERTTEVEEAKQLTAELQTQAQAQGGIPFLASFLARFTASFRANVTYKEALRQTIRNHFLQLATAFNAFLQRAEDRLTELANVDVRILFVLDGTDKLRGEDTHRFFVQDAEQLLAIRTLVVYTAPISMKYEGNLTSRLDADLVLPMIKLKTQDDEPYAVGVQAMTQILLHRAAEKLFAEGQVQRLVEFSGGHPRELLKLVKLCCEFADDDRIDSKTVDKAIAQLASEYRRFLEPDDYRVLAQLDRDDSHGGNDSCIRRLLYNLALLEYNDGSWRRPHPVVRTLDGFKRAASAAAAAAAAPKS